MNYIPQLALGAMVLALAGCSAQTQSMDQPTGMDISAQLQQNPNEGGAWTYLDPTANLKSYDSFIILPAKIFRGEGAKYGGLSDQEIQQVADMFSEELRTALQPTYPVVTTPGPNVASIQFTLIGVESTVPLVSTATRIIPIGAAINLLKSGAGGGGTLTGSVTYGIEAKDSVSNKTVAAAVRDLAPGAFDLSSTLGTMDTARAVARDAAQMVRQRLDKLHGRG
jgi:outer membrane murein-binding lipoprotein Lpp